MDSTIRATLCTCRDGLPLAVVDGLPGLGAELRPAELRALARALVQIAADAEARPKPRRVPLPPARREYRID